MDKTIEIDDSTEKTIILDSSREENNTIEILDSSSEEEEQNGNFTKFSKNQFLCGAISRKNNLKILKKFVY